MSNVLIDSQPYDTYADLEQANLYLSGAFHAANWVAASVDTRSKALITATRILDRQYWLGARTTADQPLAWPRTGVGVTGVADTVVPAAIVEAAIELALALIDGSSVQTDQNTSRQVQSLSAGSVSITYFVGADGTRLRFPLIVHELIRDYLAGYSAALSSSIATGVDVESAYDAFGLSGPI